MKLFGSYTSPFVRHCRIALAQNDHAFEFVETDYDMSAAQSPTSKVPFLSDGDITLTDSSSIVKYSREKAGFNFLSGLEEFELFVMTNTLLDSTINLFLLENNGFGPDQIPYLVRQQQRIESGLTELNSRINIRNGMEDDSNLRLACYIDWAIFRNRIDFGSHKNLLELLESANQVEVFSSTAPPK
jgi:glutathione S-transferase